MSKRSTKVANRSKVEPDNSCPYCGENSLQWRSTSKNFLNLGDFYECSSCREAGYGKRCASDDDRFCPNCKSSSFELHREVKQIYLNKIFKDRGIEYGHEALNISPARKRKIPIKAFCNSCSWQGKYSELLTNNE